MINNNKSYLLDVGPITFQVETPLPHLHHYLESHYRHNIMTPNDDTFVDFHIALTPSPFPRSVIRPQVCFSFNHRQPFKPLPSDQAHAMMEWGMNWVLSTQAHQYLIIHAATLEKEGKGIIISAPSGSGKSTLCAYLASQGWNLLSDELALICPRSLTLFGTGRPISLKNKSIEVMKPYYESKNFSRVAEDTHKGSVCLLAPNQLPSVNLKQGVTPKLLVFVNYQSNENCYIEPVKPSHALMELIKNSFNIGVLGKEGFVCAKELINATQAVYIEYNNFHHCEAQLKQTLAQLN